MKTLHTLSLIQGFIKFSTYVRKSKVSLSLRTNILNNFNLSLNANPVHSHLFLLTEIEIIEV